MTLWEKGNGMEGKFPPDDVGAASVPELFQDAAFDFVIMNDHTTAPARLETRKASKEILTESYLPLILEKNKAVTTTVLFIQTAAYSKPSMRKTEDLGDYDNFTSKLQDGYQEYAELLNKLSAERQQRVSAAVAPVGQAYQWLKQHEPDLWKRLYVQDDFHPSAHGTWLQACVLFCCMTKKAPPSYQVDFWSRARYRQRLDQEELPLPTEEEASILRKVACEICNVPSDPSSWMSDAMSSVLSFFKWT